VIENVLQTVEMERDAVLNFRVPLDVKEALRLAAEADHGRSMSAMAVRIFREWLAQHGYLEAASPAKLPARKGRR
jgi:plasmid stability protein